ncbi:hypothetical protein Tco_0779083 [Tanacetum coccineum]
MEGLHNAFEEAVGNGLITGVNIKNSTINVSHLFYADDVIITTDWNAKDMDNIIRVLHVFYLASGLKINITGLIFMVVALVFDFGKITFGRRGLLFYKLGFCFGATVVTPDIETSSTSNTHAPTTRPRGVRRVSSSKNWKPDLSAIAEDGGVLNVSRSSHESVSVTKSEKKTLNKATKARSRSYSAGDYRKFTHTMAIPAFSPTPFVF